MKSAFTMIELVFVIVILGILAAVAIPKLSASRDDAKFSVVAESMVRIVSDFSNYYNAKGTYKGSSLSDITSVELTTVTDDLVASGSGEFHFKPLNKDCIKVDVTNGSITLSNGTDITSPICTNLQALPSKKSYTFNGSGVSY